MPVYMVRDDDVERVVEAPSFGAAIGVWRADFVEAMKRDGAYESGDDEREPISVERISDEPVLREAAA